MSFIRIFLVLSISLAVLFGCDSGTSTEGSSPGECSDEADNDSDGDYDCNDSDCYGAPACNDSSDASDASDSSDSSDASDASDSSDSSDVSDASDSNCTPDCSGRECGDDGCGGSCGTCDADETCNTATGQCVSDCSPNCLGRECGDDGCGGSCGSCGPNSACDEAGECIEGCVIGTAQCTDAYAYEVCGPDTSSPTGSSYGWRIPCQEGNSCSAGSCAGDCLAPEILLLVDRSSSMNAGGRWDFVEDSIVDFVQSYQHQASIGLRMFPLGASCSAGNILSLSYENASTVSSGLVDPSADSQTPISAAFEDVLPVFGDPAEGQYTILITDGDETCSENSNASVGLVAELARSGVDTFTIGISTQANLSLLNELAQAGRTSSSYAANDSSALSAALTSIYQGVSGCYCGDGEVTASYASQSGVGEACDDGNNETETCSEGMDTCVVCDSSCNEVIGYGPYCGDGIITSPEVCDAADSPVDCVTLGEFFESGTATCSDDCSGYDLSSCIVESMVSVPAGNFMMGCNSAVDNQCYSSESPYHEVYLDAFDIDVTEVTAGDYKTCVDAGDCAYGGGSGDYHTYNNGLDNHPINYVNHTEAKTYCEAQGKRLPTEAEWEKSARGTDGRKYPWGNEAPTCDLAVMDGCPGETQPVGSLNAGASPYGAMDMAGNVWEWTADWYDSLYYEQTPAGGWVNPEGPDSGSSRVLRGGSFFNDVTNSLRASNRDDDNPGDRYSSYGFRCAQ